MLSYLRLGGYVFVGFCLFVYLFAEYLAKSYVRILTKFCGEVECGLEMNRLL